MNGPANWMSDEGRRGRGGWRIASLLGLSLVVATGGVLWGQTAAGSREGCIPDAHGSYRCSFEPFRSRLAAARTLRLETEPRDRFAQRQLRKLTEDLGKGAAEGEQPADLILVLKPAGSDGIRIGPGDQELGSLQVYAPDANGGHAALLWAETISGPGDRPWASTAGALVEQLKTRLAKARS